jgi:GNAT superfamily N-acetyltransferase
MKSRVQGWIAGSASDPERCDNDVKTRDPYPRELEDRIVLPNRRLLRIRPLRPGDTDLIRELYSRLSPRSRYLRFFSPMPSLPDSVLSLMTSADYRRQVALIGELENADGAEVVALGSFGAIDDTSAEVALVVRDEWQRQGIGIALAASILSAAEARGFDRFVAHALWENGVIRKLLRHVGEIVSTNMHHGVCEMSFVRRRWREQT